MVGARGTVRPVDDSTAVRTGPLGSTLLKAVATVPSGRRTLMLLPSVARTAPAAASVRSMTSSSSADEPIALPMRAAGSTTDHATAAI